MPSDDDIFINDQLDNHLENRLNHILFGLFLNADFREAVLEHIKLPKDSVIYKPADRSWGRPDFAVEDTDGTIVGYVEVELDQNEGQLQKYKDGAGVCVFSFGRHRHQGHQITLNELVELAWEAFSEEPSSQLELMVRHLEKQVKESSETRSQPTRIGPNALETPLGRALVGNGMVNWVDEPHKVPGKVFGRAYGPDGLSANVFSPEARERTVNVFYQTKGQPEIRFAGYDRLGRFLPEDRREKLEAWADFIQDELGGNIRGLRDKERCNVDLPTVIQNLDSLVDALWTLA